MGQSKPRLTVVLLSPEGYSGLQISMHFLRMQTICTSIELILLTKKGCDSTLDDADTCFYAVRQYEFSNTRDYKYPQALAVFLATAPYIYICENHAYPAPDCLELLLMRLDEGYGIVSPQIVDHNPRTLASLSEHIPGFGEWNCLAESGTCSRLSVHNKAFRADVLTSYGVALPTMLKTETIIQNDVLSSGLKLYFEKDAIVSHLTSSKWSYVWRARTIYSREFAGLLTKRISVYRRLYLGIIGLAITAKTYPQLLLSAYKITGSVYKTCQLAVPLLLIALLTGIALSMGFFFGGGKHERFIWNHELYRHRQLDKIDALRHEFERKSTCRTNRYRLKVA